ncbi:MAG: cyanophycinase [Longimicrobiales bacterium]
MEAGQTAERDSLGARTRDGTREGFIILIGGAEEKIGDARILSSFVHLCGDDDAHIAIIPTASELDDQGSKYEEVFRRVGVKSARALPFKVREDCEREDWLEELEQADGIFMTGGNQLRLSTIIGGTPVARAIRDASARGVHVAGTSAGAGFMSEHMIAFGGEGLLPRAGLVTMAPGLGLTNRVVVDHHFAERARLGRLMTALGLNPFAVGLGLDEDTAAFIGPDDVLNVVGSGSVTLVDPTDIEYSNLYSRADGEPVCLVNVRVHFLVDGWSFDLNTREASHKLVMPGTTPTDTS